MTPDRPPVFASIADTETQCAFLGGYPEVVKWLEPGTKLFKWTESIVTTRGITPWWQFVERCSLPSGGHCPGVRDLQTFAARLGIHERDYNRHRLAVTEQFNRMTNIVAVQLVNGAWGYIGKASGQLKDEPISGVYHIGGEYQVWIPRLFAKDIRRISILPYLKPNSPFGASSNR